MKVSVCMATYNGSLYIKSQIASILKQLNENDELVISDDGSIDDTVEIINSFNDKRIVLLHHENNIKSRKKTYTHYLVSANFENALKYSKGDIVFLADQDDIWADNRVKIALAYLKDYDLVMCNCFVIDENDVIVSDFFLKELKLPRGLLLNIAKPVYHGCCMAFKRNILEYALPFPNEMILHDTWLGILGENFGKVKFMREKLIKYRRHTDNSSFSVGKSENSLFFKLNYRVKLFNQVLMRLVVKKLIYKL